jgi:nucleoside-diphosphate-sugar epimerase
MGRTALIGATGFVGGGLATQTRFDDGYHSRNIGEIAGRSYDLVVCAGVSAAKWIANAEPEEDARAIAVLTEALDRAEVGELVLISTIDVYPDPSQPLDETAELDPQDGHPYGRHRLALERWAADTFPKVRIVRLPALFGPGLRKNALYDLIHDNEVGKLNPAGLFQWYPTARLWDDIQRVRDLDLSLVNLFPEPLALGEIVARFFPDAPVGPERRPAPSYDLRTRHGAAFAGGPDYLMSREQSLAAIADFLAQERAAP